MALEDIEYGALASSQVLNNNFNSLQTDITDTNNRLVISEANIRTYIEERISNLPTKEDILKPLYPVGSIYIGTTSECPLASLFGTWEKVAGNRALWTSDSNHTAGTTISAGLPQISGSVGVGATPWSAGGSGAFAGSAGGANGLFGGGGDSGGGKDIYFNASNSNTIYGQSGTVQPPAYVVNVWRRTA